MLGRTRGGEGGQGRKGGTQRMQRERMEAQGWVDGRDWSERIGETARERERRGKQASK